MKCLQSKDGLSLVIRHEIKALKRFTIHHPRLGIDKMAVFKKRTFFFLNKNCSEHQWGFVGEKIS